MNRLADRSTKSIQLFLVGIFDGSEKSEELKPHGKIGMIYEKFEIEDEKFA